MQSTESTTIEQQEQEEHNQLNKYDLSPHKPVYIIAVPKYHENLYKHIEKAHKWLAETETHHQKSREYNWNAKKITTKEDFDKLNKLILDLRTEKSELFIDTEYHPKQYNQTLMSYIDDFLRSKSINTHYVFNHFYRVTVYPFGENVDSYLRTVSKDSDSRQEYIIVPLLIRLKRGKTFSQSKRIVGINEKTGEPIIQELNPKHFKMDSSTVPEGDEKKNKERNEKYDDLLT